MPIITLLTIAIFIRIANENRFISRYRVPNLPRIEVLIIAFVGPLVLLDQLHLQPVLRLAWLIVFGVGGLESLIDAAHHLLPDRLTIPAILATLLLAILAGKVVPACVGALTWFTTFAFLALIHPAGLGWGDVKFAALLGLNCAAIRFELIPTAIVTSVFLGGVYAAALLISGRRKAQIAFGPFMFLGAVAALAVA